MEFGYFVPNFVPLKFPPKCDFIQNFVLNYLQSHTSEVTSYEISYEITSEVSLSSFSIIPTRQNSRNLCGYREISTSFEYNSASYALWVMLKGLQIFHFVCSDLEGG